MARQVDVRAPLEQPLRKSPLAHAQRRQQRRFPAVIARIGACSGAQQGQRRGPRPMTEHTVGHQGGIPVPVTRIDIRAGPQQRLHHLLGTCVRLGIAGREHQGRAP
ncbi:hypothetical protein D3C71_1853420 [compost metagenome]